jgi:hypothetical protein
VCPCSHARSLAVDADCVAGREARPPVRGACSVSGGEP